MKKVLPSGSGCGIIDKGLKNIWKGERVTSEKSKVKAEQAELLIPAQATSAQAEKSEMTASAQVKTANRPKATKASAIKSNALVNKSTPKFTAQAQKNLKSSQERKAYKAVKAKVFEFEKTNRDRIVVIRNGSWYKIGGNSLIFYMNYVGKRLKLSAAPKKDTDFHSEFPEGVLSFRDLDALEERLKKVKIHLSNFEDGWRSYALGFKVSDAELKKMTQEVELQRGKLNRVMMPVSSYPDLYARLRYSVKLVTDQLRKLDGAERAVVGTEASERTLRVAQDYILMANGSLSKGVFFRECKEWVEWMMSWTLVMEEIRVLKLHTCLQLGEHLQKVREMVKSSGYV